MKKIKAGIIGGAGYTAGELVRILLNHPEVELSYIHSSSHTGQPVASVHPDLWGETGIIFTSEIFPEDADVLFLCQGHGKSASFLEKEGLPDSLRIIDLSADFRIADGSHDFIYGLPELNRDLIRTARHVANPGCFATAIELGFLPLAANGMLCDSIHVQAITGSTGAGQQPTETTHFSWREGNLSAYRIFGHQHQAEILQTLKQLQPGFHDDLNFIPIRGNHTRGIFMSGYTRFEGSSEEAAGLYQSFYKDHPFAIVTPGMPSLKQVVNTNKAFISVEKHGNMLAVISCIDNLLKGASGQAVQNMNLMFGIEETSGLKLKPSAF